MFHKKTGLLELNIPLAVHVKFSSLDYVLMSCVSETKPTCYRMTWPVMANLTSAGTFLM